VGPYTAAAIAAIAFDRPAAVVDGNVERVMTRLLAIDVPLPTARTAIREQVGQMVPTDRPGDFAQAMMDLGATICTPRTPICRECPISPHCAARAAGTAADYPRKNPRLPRPVRLGLAFVGQRTDGA